jgi:hypothetical protein
MYWTYPIYKETFAAVNIHELDEFMFCTDHKVEQPCEEADEIKKDPVITPGISLLDKCRSRLPSVRKCQDPLFWSIYLAKFGKKEYDRVGLCGNEEMKEKMAMSESFHKMGAAHLSSKILQKKVTICGCSEMASNILTEKRLSWESLNIVCACYECNLYIVDLQKKTYFTYLRVNADQYDTFVLYRTREKGPEYYIDSSEQVCTLDYVRNNFVWILGYEKPLKAANHYKVHELEHMAGLLGFAKMKKAELYAKIALHCAS